jgi:hypothetical protein
MTPDDPRHGSRAGYLAGCRDGCCRAPHLEYLIQRRAVRRDAYNRAQKDGRIRRERLQALGVTVFQHPAEPVRTHTQRLAALGWSTTAMAAIHGNISDASIAILMRGNSTTVESKTHLLLNLKYTLRVPDSVPDTAWVPALGAVRRERALLALGWTHAAIRATMQELCGYSVPRCFGIQVNARKWRAFDAAYRALQGTPGPSRRTRERALALGYAPPLAWDRIDDPDASPVGLTATAAEPAGYDESRVLRRINGDRSIKLRKGETVEVVRRMLAAGHSQSAIQRLTGVKAERYMPQIRAEQATTRTGQEAAA